MAPCAIDGQDKVWMRLELRRGLQLLIAGAGNGRLKGLKQNLCIEFARSLDTPASRVEVHDIYETPGGSRTCVEFVLSPIKSTSSAALNRVASDLMDQVDKNMENVDEVCDLMKLISHIEIKGHSAERGRKTRYMLAVAALLFVIAHYYGVWAEYTTGASLGLRGSAVSSPHRGSPAALRPAKVCIDIYIYVYI